MLTRLWLSWIPLFLLAACSSGLRNHDTDDATFKAVQSVETKALRAATLCLKDVHHVLPEKSGNCVAVARKLNEIPKSYQCLGEAEQLPRCKQLQDRYHDIIDLYWRAIVIGLAREHDPAGHRLYRDDKEMARRLDDCPAAGSDNSVECIKEGADLWLSEL